MRKIAFILNTPMEDPLALDAYLEIDGVRTVERLEFDARLPYTQVDDKNRISALIQRVLERALK